MTRAATLKLKCNPATGTKPSLRWLRLDEMFVDHSYQRTLDEPRSQTLIRQIAQFWNWDLCQPLTVAKRPNGALMIVDGQHRHAAAKLRGDFDTLPCVVATYANAGDEAATFVALNRVRRPLTALDLFKAALAAEDQEATVVLSAITDAGLRLASTSNLALIKPGAVSNVGGLLRCYRGRGEQPLRVGLLVLARAYPHEVLRFGGTLFPGLAAVAADELRLRSLRDDIVDRLSALVSVKPQEEWRAIIKLAVGESGGMAREASEMVFRRLWRERYRPSLAQPANQPCKAEHRPSLTFEEQLERVNNGASIAEKIALHRGADRTLGGVTGEII